MSVSGIRGQAAKQAVTYARELHVRMYGLAKYWSPPSSCRANRCPANSPKPKKAPKARNPPKRRACRRRRLPSYNGSVVPPGGVSYYDDNEWVGIELARLYKRRHEAPLLEKAEQIMAFVMAGWQTNPKLACTGGVPFSDSPSNTDRNTVTDGPAAELGVQLYRITGQRSLPAVRADGLRMGAQLPAAAKRAVRRSHPPARRDRPDAVELQPGRR